MAADDDKRVAGPPPEEPQQPAAAASPAEPPPPAAAPHAAPPPPPQGTAPPPAGPGWRARSRDWGSRRGVQLLAAGLVGAIIGGGLVGLLDLLDDDGDDDREYVRVVPGRPYGPYDGPYYKRWRDEDWYRPMPPPEWWGRRPADPAPTVVPPTQPPSPTP